MKAILARKLNMTQLFTEDGKRLPVTVLQAEPNKVSLLRGKEKDGYSAVQLKTAKVRREVKGKTDELETGQEITVSVFEPGELVDLKSRSKGRGFAGVIKRHGFKGAPASHGHPHQRVPGAIGQAFPQHVRKGMKMAGRMGGGSVTEKNLMVTAVDPERNLLFVTGSVPGARNSLVKVVATGEKKDAPKIMQYGKASEDEQNG